MASWYELPHRPQASRKSSPPAKTPVQFFFNFQIVPGSNETRAAQSGGVYGNEPSCYNINGADSAAPAPVSEHGIPDAPADPHQEQQVRNSIPLSCAIGNSTALTPSLAARATTLVDLPAIALVGNMDHRSWSRPRSPACRLLLLIDSFRSAFGGPGRPPGMRNKLTEIALRALGDDFAVHGSAVI
jgi:hypothetical protein